MSKAIRARSEFDQRGIDDMLSEVREVAADNERVLGIRRIFDSPDIALPSLLHAQLPSPDDFACVRRFYASRGADMMTTGKVLRHMMIPALSEYPNAYRMAVRRSHLFAYDPATREFVVNLRCCLVSDESKLAYNNPKALMASLADGSIFWMGKYDRRPPAEDIAQTLGEIADRYDEEAGREEPDEHKLARLAREYQGRMSEMRRVLEDAKRRMCNVHAAVAAASEMERLGAEEAFGMPFRIDRALEERPGIGLDQFFGMAQIDERSFYRAVDSVLESFMGAFGGRACATVGSGGAVAEIERSRVTPSDEGLAKGDLEFPAICVLEGYFEEDACEFDGVGAGIGGGFDFAFAGGSADVRDDGSAARYRAMPFDTGLAEMFPNDDPRRYKASEDTLSRMSSDASWWPSDAELSRMRTEDADEIEKLEKRYLVSVADGIAD